MLDFLIRNATIFDGSGKKPYATDIAVKDGKILEVGKVSAQAMRTIDANGMAAAPGFIDIHSHTDSILFVNGRAESKITQGVTTELCGNCGFSSAPCLDETSRMEQESWRKRNNVDEDWYSLGEMLTALEKRPIALNFATMAGHANLRSYAIGFADRKATNDEIIKMKQCLREAMEQGAFGLSSGLIYPPSCFADVDEIAVLAGVAAEYGGFYSTHMRDEGDKLVEAVEEAIEVGRRSGVSVQISHHKACGKDNWGKVKTTLAMIEECRRYGMNIHVDQYPYTASSTSLSAMLPQWCYDGGDEAVLACIANRRAELLESLRSEGNTDEWKSVLISSVASDKNRSCEGMSIFDIAKAGETEPEEVVLDLLSEEKLAVSMVHFSMSEEDIETVMRASFTMVGSDASARSITGSGKPHPRAFGTFTRVLGEYSRKRGVIPLEFAVHKMTGLPAQKMGLKDRGLINNGNWADLVIFNPDEVSDTATYKNPHQVSKGIEFVFVNGKLAIEKGVITGEMAGKVLRHYA